MDTVQDPQVGGWPWLGYVFVVLLMLLADLIVPSEKRNSNGIE